MPLGEKDFYAFRQSILEYIAGLKEWQNTTTEYRKSLCSKVDEINNKLAKLPCDKRISIYESLDKQVKILWGAFAIVLIKALIDWLNK